MLNKLSEFCDCHMFLFLAVIVCVLIIIIFFSLVNVDYGGNIANGHFFLQAVHLHKYQKQKRK